MYFVFLLVAFSVAAHPECRWACDDPVCSAICNPVCAAPVCQVQCDVPGTAQACGQPICSTRCPPDQSEADSCPACETVCQPLPCACHVLCEATNCSWSCRKPGNCRQPRCELQCERPACEYVRSSGASAAVAAEAWAVGLLMVLLIANN